MMTDAETLEAGEMALDDVPDCPQHGEDVAEADCEICDCRWLLITGEAEDVSATRSDLRTLLDDPEVWPAFIEREGLRQKTVRTSTSPTDRKE